MDFVDKSRRVEFGIGKGFYFFVRYKTMIAMKNTSVLLITCVLLLIGCEGGITSSSNIANDESVNQVETVPHDFRSYRFSYADASVKALDPLIRNTLLIETRVYLDEFYASEKERGEHARSYLRDDELDLFKKKMASYRASIGSEAELLFVDQIIATYAVDLFLVEAQDGYGSNMSTERYELLDHYTNELLRTQSYDVPVLAKGMSAMYRLWPQDKMNNALDYALEIAGKFEAQPGKTDLDASKFDILPDHVREDAAIGSKIRSLNAVEALELMKDNLSAAYSD